LSGPVPFYLADVASSPDMEDLLLVPRPGVRAGQLRQLVARVTGAPASRGGSPVAVPAMQAWKLLDASVDGLHWREEAIAMAENRRRVAHVHPRVHADVELIKLAGAGKARALVADLDGIERLDDHQVVNVAAMVVAGGPGICVFDEQGAGKTVTAIYAFDLLVKRDEADTALIVAPKSMVSEWPQDLRRFKDDLYRVEILAGDRAGKFTSLASGADVYVTNFETAISMEAELTSMLRGRNGRVVLIVDESFFIKNLEAKRTAALRRLREWCVRAYVLCGTPAPNAPHDLVQQFNLVDFGLAFDGVTVPRDREEARLVVRQAMEARGLYVRHLKSDVLADLPGRAFHEVRVELQPQQEAAYRRVLEGYVADLRSTTEHDFQRQRASFLARRMALLQICSNPTRLVPSYTETPAKLLALDRIMGEVSSRADKVVVWSFFRASIDAIMARYAGLRPLRYDGSVTDVAERREAVRAFQEDDSRPLLIGNPAAAGAGLTLHRARFAVYESMSNQAAHYLQSLDRIHRRGQQREVEYVVLLCEGTIELNEYALLRRKERAGHDLLGDQVEPLATRQTLLAEAMCEPLLAPR
jgi:SNF2 family DNA or RNA helicase